MGLLSYVSLAKNAKTRNMDTEMLVRDEKALAPITGATTPTRSPWASRPGSLYANSELSYAAELRSDVLANWIYQEQMRLLWSDGNHDEGVIVKKSRGQYTCCPPDLESLHGGLFFAAVQALNVKCAMTVNSRIITLFLEKYPDTSFVPLKNGLRLQVLSDMSCLPSSQRHHFAAFIANKGTLVVWDDDPRNLIKRASGIQESLMSVVWPEESEEQEEDYSKEKLPVINVNEVDSDDGDSVEQQATEKPRRIVLNQAVLMAFTLMLVTVSTGSGYAQIAKQIYLDGNYVRIAFVAALPAQIWLSLFFFQALVGNIAQIIGPISQVRQNSKTYSGVAPVRNLTGQLPHVTIQIPVYKEGLRAVIEPTVHSIKAAISTYEMQGGTANIFINDDGMQLLPEEEAHARQEFYDEHNIGWVARPRHDPRGEHGPEPFIRRGKFKKASNMNYALWISNRVEEILLGVHRPYDSWTQKNESIAYSDALTQVVQEDSGRTWADGNIRIGDYLLLIDSDTRVPMDCFLDAVTEMERSPQVAIIQMNSGVMNVTESFFEKGITFFTNLVYTQIKYAVANGDVAPFVGHNAIIRWSAVQAISYEDEDEREKFWSESTVSEDFDMALRLQAAGYVLRYASYFGSGFKEGVSLTVYDELARWEKYAYGCNELIFHPVKYWLTRGPFTLLFRRFVKSNMPVSSKISIMAYVGTYYALGSAFPLTLMNYFLIGWFNGWLDHYYLDSFKVYLSIIVVFTALGNFALAALRYRLGDQSLLGALYLNLKWIPLMSIFLGGISIHVSQALLSHMFGIDMNWGATSKEVENTTFFAEVPKVIKNFKFTFAGAILLSAMMALMGTIAPEMWKIDLLPAIFPLAMSVASHFLLPIILNPSLMLFTW